MTKLIIAVFFSTSFCGDFLHAAELGSLVSEYRRAVKKIIGPPKGRGGKVKEHVTPLLVKIAKIDSKESLGFLAGELKGASMPQVAAACAAPILAHSNSRAPIILLSDFSRRPPIVQVSILDAVGRTKKDISSAERELLALSKARLRPEVKAKLPQALMKLGTVAAAKGLMGQIKPAGKANSRRGGGEQEAKYRLQVIEALKGTKSSEIKGWLADDAFSAVGKNPAALSALLEIVGSLKLEEARPGVVKSVSHKSSEVAGSAVKALVDMGVGDASAVIAKALKKRRGSASLDFRIYAMDALAVSGDSAALDVVIGLAKGKDSESRAIAMGSLARASSNRKALRALVKGLKDEDQSVRSVALRSLGGVRQKGMIGPLIKALGDDSNYSFQVKILEFLVALTGQNMGLVTEDWGKWWEIAEAKFEFPKGGKGEFTSVTAYGLDYFGIEISSKRMTFIVDRSSSMRQKVKVRKRKKGEGGGEKPRGRTRGGKRGGDGEGKDLGDNAMKIDILKVELGRVIKKLSADSFINIITFDAKFKAWQRKLQPLSGSGRGKALKFARTINTGSGTNVFDSLEEALKDKRVDTFYLMTDGVPTRGRITNPDALVAEITRLNRVRAVTIHCIAFGEESKMLEKLAAKNGGKYRFVDEY